MTRTAVKDGSSGEDKIRFVFQVVSEQNSRIRAKDVSFRVRTNVNSSKRLSAGLVSLEAVNVGPQVDGENHGVWTKCDLRHGTWRQWTDYIQELKKLWNRIRTRIYYAVLQKDYKYDIEDFAKPNTSSSRQRKCFSRWRMMLKEVTRELYASVAGNKRKVRWSTKKYHHHMEEYYVRCTSWRGQIWMSSPTSESQTKGRRMRKKSGTSETQTVTGQSCDRRMTSWSKLSTLNVKKVLDKLGVRIRSTSTGTWRKSN